MKVKVISDEKFKNKVIFFRVMARLSNNSLFRETTVDSIDGKVLVSTVSVGDARFETLVFPILQDDRPDLSIELHSSFDSKPKDARRTHREACSQFDRYHRKYEYSSQLRRYIPINPN